MPTETNRPLEVEFYPSVDDYVHIATVTAATVPASSWHHTFFSYFVYANFFITPILLWIGEYLVIGSILFLINCGVMFFILPEIQRGGFRKYYEHLVGNREKSIATVRIDQEGLRYIHEGADSFWPWSKFDRVEETPEAIFFFYDGNGVAIRKNGFAYRERERDFFQFASKMVLSSDTKLIENA